MTNNKATKKAPFVCYPPDTKAKATFNESVFSLKDWQKIKGRGPDMWLASRNHPAGREVALFFRKVDSAQKLGIALVKLPQNTLALADDKARSAPDTKRKAPKRAGDSKQKTKTIIETAELLLTNMEARGRLSNTLTKYSGRIQRSYTNE